MQVKRAYKTELDLNNEQATACVKHAGAARFAFNWGLRQIIDARERGEKKPSAIELHKKLNALKVSEFSWMYEVSKCAPQEALRNLDAAFNGFFRRCKSGAKKKGFPKFKSKKKGVGSFRLTGTIKIVERMIQLPRLGELRLKETGYLPVGMKVSQATVSEKNGRWYISVLAKIEADEWVESDRPVVGVDLGIQNLATLSNGEVIENPKHLRTAQRKLTRLQRVVARRQKGSGRRKDAVIRVAKLHERISNKRKDTIHKFTTKLTRESSVIGIEDLNVSGMLSNHRLAGAIADAAFFEMRRQIEYKAKWYGSQVVVYPRFEPSSKKLHCCGVVLDQLTLSDRTLTCPQCGKVVDRDHNAAINIRNFAASYVEKSNGRGEESADTCRKAGVKLSSMKRQPNVRARTVLFV